MSDAGLEPTQTLARTAPDDRPQVLGRYRLVRRLGAGAYGTVWRAHDEQLERDVAVKIIPLERVAGGRFEREARAAARLTHPGIVTLFEAGSDAEGAYLVSELVRGATLERLVADGSLSDHDVGQIGLALCDALEHAHAAGVVHRDVKPSNILVPRRPSTSGERAKLTDFGIARVIDADTLTRTGDVLGTAAYMAPEQAEGHAAGVEADLFSLAVVLYEALTGVNPRGGRPGAVHRRRLTVELPPLRRQRRGLPRELTQAIDRAARPRPADRGTLAELRQAIAIALPALDMTAGVVAPPITATRLRESVLAPSRAPAARPAWAPRRPHHRPYLSPAVETDDALEAELDPRTRWAPRALGAGGTAALAALVLRHGHLPLAPLVLLAGLAALVAPRLAYAALSAAAVVALATSGRSGTALLLTAATLVPPLLLVECGSLWSLAALPAASGDLARGFALPAAVLTVLAVALIGLAPRRRLFVGPGPLLRARLGAAVWLTLVASLPLTGAAASVWLGPPLRLPSAEAWGHDASMALHDVLAPLASSPLPEVGLLWAAVAAAAGARPMARLARRPALVAAFAAAALILGSALVLRAVGAPVNLP